MTVADLHDWFPDDVLVVCPSCGRRRALATKATGYYVCLECGLVAPNGAPVGSALTLVPPLQDRQASNGGCGDDPSPRILRRSRTIAACGSTEESPGSHCVALFDRAVTSAGRAALD
jgi:hypothetical protein